MGYTYDPALSTDLSLVRFHVGDNSDKGHYLDDGEITYWLTASGSVGGAVLACIKYIITRLSQPDFRLDWMSVSNASALAGFQELLKIKAQEFGLSATGAVPTSSIAFSHRADSYEANEDGTYDDPDGAP